MQETVDKWRQGQQEKFQSEFGRMPERGEIPRFNPLVSLEQLQEKGAGYFRQGWDEEVPPDVERLQEIVASLPENWQEIYKRVLIEGFPMAEVARQRGVTEGAVRKVVNKIRSRIAEDEVLKNYFS